MVIDDALTSKEEVLSWATANVRQNPSLSIIELDHVSLRPDLLEYLMYKYSGNVATIKSNGYFTYPSSESMNRILDATDEIQTRNLTFSLPDNMLVKEALAFVRTQKKRINLSVESIYGQEEIVMQLK